MQLKEITVWKATSRSGETCAFGVESLARIWAKNGGSVEALRFGPSVEPPIAPKSESANAMLDRWANWILNHPPSYGGDHACAQCYPKSEIIQPGFVCAYHEADGWVSRRTLGAEAERLR